MRAFTVSPPPFSSVMLWMVQNYLVATQPDAQPVADVVETDGMGKLGEKHRGQMAAHAKGPRLGIHSGFPGDSSHHPARNELEKLVENDIWIGLVCVFCSYTLPSGRESNRTPARFFHFFRKSYGMPVI